MSHDRRAHGIAAERARRRGRTLPALLLAGLVAVSAGCDSILSVDLPGKVPADSLSNPSLANTLVSGVVADFECAYDDYTFGSASRSDVTTPASGNAVERRWALNNITSSFDNYVNGTCEGAGYGIWTTLQTARFQAENVFQRLDAFSESEVPDRTSKMATVSAYAGYAYTLFGEGFCQVRFDGGPIQEPLAALQTAEERFTRAIDLAGQSGNQDALNMAYVGRARARLDMGDAAGAASDAANVPDGYVKMATRDGPSPAVQRRWNKGEYQFAEFGHVTIAPDWRDLQWKGVADPRVPVVNTGRAGFDGVTPLWVTTKYPERSSDIPLATWTEAQLIIAEAEGGQAAVDIINELHSRAGLPSYDPSTDTTPGPTNDEITNHVIQERSRALFMQGGERINDMLRFGIPFPSGTDPVGNPYGNTTCYPLPDVEKG